MPAVLAVLLLSVSVAALSPQDGAGHAEPAPWLEGAQGADGRFLATAGPDGGRAVRDGRVTALAVLAHLADGSTLQSGPYRDRIEAAVGWLLAQQDDRGRIALHTEPDWILDHAMCTHALCEAGGAGASRKLEQATVRAVAVLNGHLARFTDGVGPELLLWCRMTAVCAPRLEGVATLGDHVDRLATRAVPPAGRQRAAAWLLEVLSAMAHDADRRSDHERMLAAACLGDEMDEVAEDPLAVWYLALAGWRTGEMVRSPAIEELFETTVASERHSGPARRSWDPAGAFGREHGRLGTTAVNVLTLTLYYRYCRLAVAAAD